MKKGMQLIVVLLVVFFTACQKEVVVKTHSNNEFKTNHKWYTQIEELTIEGKFQNLIDKPFEKVKFTEAMDQSQTLSRLPKRYSGKFLSASVILDYEKIKKYIEKNNLKGIAECVYRIHKTTRSGPVATNFLMSNNTESFRIGDVSYVPEEVGVIVSLFNYHREELVLYRGIVKAGGERKYDDEEIDIFLKGIVVTNNKVFLRVSKTIAPPNYEEISFHYNTDLETYSQFGKGYGKKGQGYGKILGKHYENYVPIDLGHISNNSLLTVGIDSIWVDGVYLKDIRLDNNYTSLNLNKIKTPKAGDYKLVKSSVDFGSTITMQDLLCFEVEYSGYMFDEEFRDDDVLLINIAKQQFVPVAYHPPMSKFFCPNLEPADYVLIINPNRRRPEFKTSDNDYRFTIEDEGIR